jgi:DNA-binding GntR family transcriptional regulator
MSLLSTAEDTSLRRQVYDSLREALTAGRFIPGQKLTFRFVAGALGVSLTPVREALRRLVAEGAFEMQPSRSVRVPLMTRARILELRDIRIALEGLAAEKAAERASKQQIGRLRRIALEIATARSAGDSVTDRLRSASSILRAMLLPTDLAAPHRRLWLQTGPTEPPLSRVHQPAARTGDTDAHHPRPAVARCGCGAPGN